MNHPGLDEPVLIVANAFGDVIAAHVQRRANGELVAWGSGYSRTLHAHEEGTTWARGWHTPEADALRTIAALDDTAANPSTRSGRTHHTHPNIHNLPRGSS